MLAIDLVDSDVVCHRKVGSRIRWIWLSLKCFMSVCKYWRDVALLSPLLWREVHFGNGVSRRIMEKMLRRSGQAPLHLTVYYDHNGPRNFPDQTNVDVLVPELCRVTQLHTQVRFLKDHKLPAGTSDAPYLRDLKVEVLDCMRPMLPIPLISPNNPFQSLQSLQTYGIAFQYASSFFRSTLKRLHLRHDPIAFQRLHLRNPPMGHEASIADFIHALRGTPLLEELSIKSIFRNDLRSTPEIKLPNVQLASLRSFRMEDNRIACAAVLDHTTFPASVLLPRQFTAIGERKDERVAGQLPTYQDLLASVLTKLAGQGIIGTVPNPSIFKIKNRTESKYPLVADLEAWQDDDHISQPFFSSCTEAYWGVGELLNRICFTAPKHLFADVHTLAVISGVEDESAPSPFAEVATGFANVETLHLERTRGVWEALAKLHRSSEEDTSFSPALLLFPKLRVLTLTSTTFREDTPERDVDPAFVFTLREMLKVRRDAGIPLHTLRISDGINLVEEDVQMLRAYVDEVDWDGR